MMRKLAAGNWKMNGLGDSLAEIRALAKAFPNPACDVLICPPATLLAGMTDKAGPIATGGQDCHSAASGAHTGDTSAAMLKDAGPVPAAPFDGFSVLEPARDFKNRHASILLAMQATLAAMDGAEEAKLADTAI